MNTLDASIVNIALPSIANAFGQPLNGKVQWTIIVYLVVLASTLLAFGRLADMYGGKRVWSAGIIVFTVGSVACGLAPSLTALITFRGLQGLGASMMMAPSAALISHTFSSTERGRALGINAVVVSVGVSSGPVLGGYLTQYLSWEYIFFINLPIGVITYFWTLHTLPQAPHAHRSNERFDVWGGILIAVGLGGLTLGTSFGPDWGWDSPRILAALGLGLAGTFAAYFVERRVADPLVNLSFFNNRMFTLSFVTLLLCSMTIVTAVLLLPFYYEQLRDFSTSRSGLLMTPAALALGVVGPVAGRLSDRFGSTYLVPLGLLLNAVSFLMLCFVDARTAVGYVVLALIISGVGRGMFFPANSSTLMNNTPPEGLGIGSSMLSTGRLIGQSVGIALAGALFNGLDGATAGDALEHGTRTAALEGTFVHAFGTAMLVAGAIGLVATIVSLLRGRTRPSRANAAPASAPPAHAGPGLP